MTQHQNQYAHSRWGDMNGDGPWWMRAIVRYGIGTAFAAVLLWALLARFDRTLEMMRNEHQILMFYGRAACLNLARLAESDERAIAVATCQPPTPLLQRLENDAKQ